jgi:hypothetical protein
LNLFHVSEQGGIERFEPRMPPSLDAGVVEPVVWAVAESRLGNYLLPRECPRVCVRAGLATTPADRERYVGAGSHLAVVYIEEGWVERVATARLWLYRFEPQLFRCVDAPAGYYASTEAVAPIESVRIEAPFDALSQRHVAVRALSHLRALARDVAASSLEFSIIRLRNARPADPVA